MPRFIAYFLIGILVLSLQNCADNATNSKNEEPIIEITSPASGSQHTIGNNVNMSASASDADGSIASVKFYVDGDLQSTDSSSPYSYNWNTTGYDAGSHTIIARATDDDGASTDAEISVILDSPANQSPAVSITAPANNSHHTIGNSVNISASASDGDGSIASVKFYVDGSLKTTDTSSPYSYSWSTTGYSAGSHTIRARATDDDGATTDAEITVVLSPTMTDIDGNVYQTIKIGNQWWMAENLKVTHYRNGDPIPNVTGSTEWDNLSSGAYCAYNNDNGNAATYGMLYNWYVVDDSRNIAPEGWHVPTDEEWKALEMHLGMSQSEADEIGDRGTDEGGKLKEAGTTHWNSPNSGATNSSGFTALPGGYRFYDGRFNNMGYNGYWWSATANYTGSVWFRLLQNSRSFVYRNTGHKQLGLSVRLVKDAE
jgi:uncharacterized protein (TIGR02145 family)